ncbi:MAG: biotin--[acetyl-CoA-carboxylase] ligase [Haloechinothrix sp.]
MGTPDSTLDSTRLRSELVTPAGPYSALDVVAITGSTNADLCAAAGHGAADRTVLIAGQQTAGVGRLSRSWSSPAGTGLYLSVLLRPQGVALEGVGSLAIVAGLALMDLARVVAVPTALKWPNDVLAGAAEPRAKCAGILSELVPLPGGREFAVVLGIGVNVLPLTGVPPGPGGLPATSLAEHGANTTDRGEVAIVLLRALADREQRWRQAGGDLAAADLLAEYREYCSTLGARVRVDLPDGAGMSGRAVDVDSRGQLVVESAEGARHTVSAGDVVHVRVHGDEQGDSRYR